nr:biotin/lipoyl-binding protein [Veillonella denticariosi]
MILSHEIAIDGIKERFYESKSHINDSRHHDRGATLISGCGSEKQTDEASLKVRTITIGEESGTTGAGYSGTVHNRTETNLAFQIGGRVINKFASVGDQVEAGQVIAQINGADTASQVQNAEGAVKAAQSAYDLANTNAKRYRELYAQQAISKLQLDQAENQLNASAAQLQQAQASLNLSSNQDSYTNLIAPRYGHHHEPHHRTGSGRSGGPTGGHIGGRS